MALKDTPVELERIIEVTGKDKVTFMGYSQGSSLMYYALAKDQDYYADKVHRFIALASCI